MQKENEFRHCPNQWKLDVNDRYQMAVGVITSLSTASFVLPLFFLKQVLNLHDKSIADALSGWVYVGWAGLAISIASAIVYYFCSAKWVKLAWEKEADIFGIKVGNALVEKLLDYSYFLMMVGFIGGFACTIIFMVTYTH